MSAKTTIAVPRAWLTGEILGYLEVLRDVCEWNDDPQLDAHIERIRKMKDA
jgi:hypothetical protein